MSYKFRRNPYYNTPFKQVVRDEFKDVLEDPFKTTLVLTSTSGGKMKISGPEAQKLLRKGLMDGACTTVGS